MHDDLGWKNRTTRYILPRHWLYERFSQFHSCGTYSVLSCSHSINIQYNDITKLQLSVKMGFFNKNQQCIVHQHFQTGLSLRNNKIFVVHHAEISTFNNSRVLCMTVSSVLAPVLHCCRMEECMCLSGH